MGAADFFVLILNKDGSGANSTSSERQIYFTQILTFQSPANCTGGQICGKIHAKCPRPRGLTIINKNI